MGSIRRLKTVTLTLLAALLLAGALGAALAPTKGSAQDEPIKTIAVDVAEDMSRFVFDTDVVFEDGMPKHGSAFITQGYIYPAGTLTESNGVLADGSPEFPDKVLGEWTCRGWFVGEGAHAKTGPMVISTQIYNFGETLGAEMIVTEGYELADVGVIVNRAITGGTGQYLGAYGQAEQTFLGFNATEGVNLRLEINVETR
jgi:hypothetical protein